MEPRAAKFFDSQIKALDGEQEVFCEVETGRRWELKRGRPKRTLVKVETTVLFWAPLFERVFASVPGRGDSVASDLGT